MGSVAAATSTADIAQTKTRETKLAPSKQPSELLAVEERNGSVAISGGGPSIIEQLSRQASVTSSRNGALVLGFDSPAGAQATVDIPLGKVKFQRFLAAARKKLWWMTPEWGSVPGKLPPETQFLLLELGDEGPYAILLPLIDSDTFRATLRPPRRDTPAEQLVLRIESGDESVLGDKWPSALLVAAGRDPFELVDTAVAAAAAMSGGAKPRTQKQLPATLDVFGWCTWDAFYSRVSAQGLHEGLASLVEGGVPPRFLIIDDGWQNTDVDKRFRSPPTSRNMPQSKQFQDASDEYFDAEIEVLAEAKKDIPPSSSAGLALKQLTEEEGLPHHSKRPRTKSKGKWLAQTIKETMTSISMNEDLYESDDEGLPPGALRDFQENGASAKQSQSADTSRSADANEPMNQAAGAEAASEDGSGPAAGTKKPPVSLQQALDRKPRVGAGTMAADEERADVVKAGDKQHKPAHHRWPGSRVIGPVIGLIVAIIQRVAGLSMGALEVFLLKFYQWVVDTAPPNGWAVKTFTYLSTGPFKEMLLAFYAASGDFTRRLTSVKANSKFSSPTAGPDDYFSGMPEDLRAVVASLRDGYGVDYVYCWHGLPAYWSGISVEDPGTASYRPQLMFAKGTEGLYEIEPSMRWNPAVVAGVGMIRDPTPLYRDMHAYLASAGVTGVKVDCQAGVGMMGSMCGGGPALAADFHAALEDSIRTHFPGNHCINCMAHSTENIYRWTDTAVARASDDFYPRDPASSTPHVGACAFLSLFLSPLVQPDWDMFHSKHPASELHARARVLSGGSIYVSDYPGQHDFEVLRRLVLPDGSILRAQLPGRPTRDSLFSDVLRDNKSLLKVWNVNRHSGLVGVFHLQGAAWSRFSRQFIIHDATPPPLTTTVRVADVEPLAAAGSPSGKWALYDDAANRLVALTSADSYSIWVEAGRSTIITMAAIQEQDGVQFAPLGLTNMMNAGGAILDFSLSATSGKSSSSSGNGSSTAAAVSASLRAKGNGKLLMFANQAPQRITVDGADAEFDFDEQTSGLSVQLSNGEKLTRELAVQF